MNGSAASGGLFGGAQPLFGTSTPAATAEAPPDLSSLTISPPQPVASSSRTLAPPLPAYQPPQYLSTIGEYLAPPSMDIDSESDDEDDNADPSWKDEQWERLLRKGVDEVFDKYVRRLEAAEDGRSQVLRYELGGCPLPYSGQSDLFKKLFPKAPIPSRPEDEDDLDLTTYYDPSPIPRCSCGAKRVFELQLVPSLISILSPDSLSSTGERSKRGSKSKQTEEQRKKELARLAAGEAGQKDGEASEMEWGSVLVFGCEADCEGWKEEWVGVEWEGALSLGPLPEAQQQQSIASVVQATA